MRRRARRRITQTRSDLAPLGFEILLQVPGRLIAIGAKLSGLDFSLRANETREFTAPLVKIRKYICLRGHMFSLVLAVFFAFAKFHITPQIVRHFDPTV